MVAHILALAGAGCCAVVFLGVWALIRLENEED